VNTHANGFRELAVGDRFPALQLALSARGNDRYWGGAGGEHDARRDGLLYPPMAANLTILLVQQTVPEALLHAEQSLTCIGAAGAGVDLVVNGVVAERFEKRGRDYAVIDATVAVRDGEPLWRSRATFTPTGTPARTKAKGPTAQRALEPAPRADARRSLHLDADALRAYSRAGNYHSDPAEARRLGLPGLVAQGMQICGPAYGVLLDTWGTEFLTHGRFDARFVGMVVDDQTVDAVVELGRDDARFEVRDGNRRVAALGTARRLCGVEGARAGEARA
jgi:acyl dehydratase